MNQIVKKLITAGMMCAMVYSLNVDAFAAGTLDHFKSVRTYENQFSDIQSWYERDIIFGYELGLFDGSGGEGFQPNSSVTVGEAVKLAACIHSIYETGEAEFEQSTSWWQVYSDYCMLKGIINKPYEDYSNAISRGEFATLLAAALPEHALTVLNEIPDDAIPDVKLSDPYGPAVYRLYRAGVLTGSGESGVFRPDTNIRRGEMAAIVSRMVRVSERKYVTLGSNDRVLSGEEIYAKCAPSVFLMTIYDKDGKEMGYGSGVFISKDGEAVTNWHVLDGARSAKIKTYDGKIHDVIGVYDYDVKNDLVRIKIGGNGFEPMKVNDSGEQMNGATVYAIGNPKGLESTISAGIISSAHRLMNGVEFIQISAPISSGSSGGALINTKGELIGITAAYIDNGQNLNLATPITILSKLEEKTYTSVARNAEEYIESLVSGFKLSLYDVRLAPESTMKVICTIPDVPKGYSLSYDIEDGGVVGCSWGEWGKDDSVELRLHGIDEGETIIAINFSDRSGRVLATRTIKVQVQ